jgi:hypothetical protein
MRAVPRLTASIWTLSDVASRFGVALHHFAVITRLYKCNAKRMTCCSVRFLMGRSIKTGNCVFRSSLRVPAQFLHGFIDISIRPAVLTPIPSLSIVVRSYLVVTSTLIHPRLHFHRQTAPVIGTSHLHPSSCSLLPFPQNLQLLRFST